MSWVPLAIAALPAVMSMLNKSPDVPGRSGVGNIRLPDRSQYQNQILESGFNPQSELYRLAAQRSQADMSARMAAQGFGQGSSMGNMWASQNQADLANKFLENELNRRVQAFQSATGYDVQSANTAMGAMNAGNAENWQNYQAQMQRQQAMYNGMNSLAQAGSAAYGNYMANERADAADARAQNNFNIAMGRYQTPPNTYNNGVAMSTLPQLQQPNFGSQPDNKGGYYTF